MEEATIKHRHRKHVRKNCTIQHCISQWYASLHLKSPRPSDPNNLIIRKKCTLCIQPHNIHQPKKWKKFSQTKPRHLNQVWKIMRNTIYGLPLNNQVTLEIKTKLRCELHVWSIQGLLYHSCLLKSRYVPSRTPVHL